MYAIERFCAIDPKLDDMEEWWNARYLWLQLLCYWTHSCCIRQELDTKKDCDWYQSNAIEIYRSSSRVGGGGEGGVNSLARASNRTDNTYRECISSITLHTLIRQQVFYIIRASASLMVVTHTNCRVIHVTARVVQRGVFSSGTWAWLYNVEIQHSSNIWWVGGYDVVYCIVYDVQDYNGLCISWISNCHCFYR